ncbi:MAG: hypothetical protein MJ137_06305 [Clostridia bacterium]|nr:hypothetical protein [Clostridia bacterium]
MKKRIQKEKLIHYSVRAAVFAVWFIFYFYLCLCHEPFRDEAQSWMIAKHSTVREIISFCWEEGHPWLWHLFLKPFAALGFRYEWVKFIGFSLTSAAMGIYIFKSTLPLPVTAITSFLEFSYYSSFGRCYSLMLLICMLTAASWKKRAERPAVTSLMIGLMASTHLIAWPASAILGCIHLSDILKSSHSRAVKIICPLIGLIPAALFCLPLKKQFDITFAKFGWPPIPIFLGIILVAVCAVTVMTNYETALKGHGEFIKKSLYAFYLIAPIFTAVSTYILLTKATDSTVAAETNLLHVCEVIPVVLIMFWIGDERLKELFPKEQNSAEIRIRQTAFALSAVFIWSFGMNLTNLHDKIWADTESYYSGSEPMAEYIEKNIPGDAVILATRRGTMTSIAAYIDETHTLTSLISRKPLYYTKWCTDWPKVSKDQWTEDMRYWLSRKDEIYVIYSDDTEISEFGSWLSRQCIRGKAEKLYSSSSYGENFDAEDKYKPIERCEQFSIYKITGM